jgi:ubiquinone biosynthesis protein COQ4
MTSPVVPSRFAPLEALDAIRRIKRNKEDTAQVFRLLFALRGKSMARNFKRFRNSPVGARVLAQREDLVDRLTDRQWLEALPEQSLGRAFIAFLDGCGITPEGLNDAARDAGADQTPGSEDLRRFENRLRVQHDLWHVISGYGCDGFGEVCNLAFSYPHTRNIGLMLLAIVGAHNYARFFPGEPVRAAMWQGFRRGRRATWLPGVDWEALLPQPLMQVRAQLGVTEPPSHYHAAPRAKASRQTAVPGLA